MTCDRLDKCPWVKEYRPKRTVFIDQYIKQYCEGDLEDKCKRKIVANALGPAAVPLNMQPVGRPMPGTDDAAWPDQVKKLVK